MVLKSWRSKTNKSYDSLFGRWSCWCDRRDSDPFSGPVSEVTNFLAELHENGFQYNSINTYRSAISSVHWKIEGVSVGQHPTITRPLKGVYHDIHVPPVPRYISTWNVQQVLDYIKALGDSSLLPLRLQSWKTAFLLAITRLSRQQTYPNWIGPGNSIDVY